MNQLPNISAMPKTLEIQSRRFSRIASSVAAAFPLVAAVGWIFRVPFLTQIFPSLPAMQPNACVGLLLGAFAVFWASEGRKEKQQAGAGFILAALILALGLLSLSQYLFGLDLRIDRILIPRWAMTGQPYAGRPSPQTSVNFILFGAALLFYRNPSTSRFGQTCGILVGTNAIVALTGYIFSISEFYGFPTLNAAIGMAVPTALGFVLLSAALISAHPDFGVMTLLTSQTQSGGMARRILLVSVLAPPVVGLLTRIGEIRGWYNSRVQISLFTVLLLGVILKATWAAARRAEREELRAKINRDERQILAALVENSSDFIGVADPSGKPVYVNPAGRRMVGLVSDYPIEKTKILEYYPPEQRSFASDVILKSMVEQGYWKGETYFWNGNTETPIPVSEDRFVIRERGTERVLGMGTVARDITEITRVRNQLQESERKFRTLAEAIPQMVWITRPDGWNTYFNQKWVDYTGLTLEESYGHGWSIPIHPDDRKRAWDAWQNAVKTDGIYSLECRLRRVDGAYRWWLVRGVSQHDENGKITSWFGTCTDIEDIRKAHEELQIAEEKSKDLIENAPDAFVIVNESGMIEVVNRLVEKWFGYERAELIGQPIDILVPELFKNHHMEQRPEYFSQLRTGLMGEERELFARRKNGTEFPVEIRLSPIVTAKGKLIASIIRDISARKAAEKKSTSVSDLLSLALRSAQIGSWSWDIGTNHIQWDEHMERLFGVKKGEYPPTLEHFQSKVHPDDLAAVKAALNKSIELRVSYKIDYRIIWSDQSVHSISASGETEFDDKDGTPKTMTGVCWDITAQKQTFRDLEVLKKSLEQQVQKRTEELIRSETQLRVITDNIPALISYIDLNHRYRYLNAGYEKWFGKKREELIGHSMREVLGEQAYKKLLPHVSSALAGQSTSFEQEIPYRGGGTRFIHANYVPDIDDQGRTVGLFVMVSDLSALKRSQEALQVSEEQFRHLAEAIPQLCWIARPDGHIFWYNQRWYTYTGTTAKEMEGWGWKSVLDQKFLPNVIERWQKSLQTGEPFEMEFPIRGADGQFQWFLTRVLPLRDSQNKIINWFGTNTNIDSQRKFSDEIRKSELKFRKIFDSDIVGLVFWNRQGAMVDANDSFLNSVGYSREDLKAGIVNWYRMTPPEWNEVDTKALRTLAERGVAPPFEKEYFRKDGSKVPVVIGAATLQGVPGIDGIAYVLDISERKRLENVRDKVLDALKKSEESYRLIVESVSDYAIYMLDVNGKVLSWNAGAEKLKGYNASEVIGKNFEIFYSLKDIEDGKPAQLLKNAAVEGKYEDESLRRRKDGSEFWASTVISAIRDQNGGLKGFVKVVRDITERRNASLALKNANETLEARVVARTQELVRSNKELEQFAYIASHDLQTPLRHVASYLQLLVSKIRTTTVLDPQSEKWIEYILSGTRQMKALINDLLTYSRVGRTDISTEEVSLQTVITQVTEVLREPIRRTSAKIVCGELPVVFGVRSQIIQLFQNLIENALKFRKPDLAPIIEVTFEDQGEFWKFYISDNGIGIDPKYSERIFAMFQRLHTSSEYSGTGIGLAICKKIVDFHGGKIGVDSAEGKGSTFFFSLPKKERVTSPGYKEANGLENRS